MQRKNIGKKKLIDTDDKKLPRIYQIPRFIDESEVLQLTSRGWYIGKHKLSGPEVSALKAEALDFQKSYLWQLMRRDVHYVAYLQSTTKRASELDAVYGGAMYRCLSILEEFIKQCQTL